MFVCPSVHLYAFCLWFYLLNRDKKYINLSRFPFRTKYVKGIFAMPQNSLNDVSLCVFSSFILRCGSRHSWIHAKCDINHKNMTFMFSCCAWIITVFVCATVKKWCLKMWFNLFNNRTKFAHLSITDRIEITNFKIKNQFE